MPAYRDKRHGTWRYRKWLRLPNGTTTRIVGTPAINTKQHAEMAERAHIARLVDPSHPAPQKEVPLFKEFVKEFMDGYVKSNNKLSEQVGKEILFRTKLLPVFGEMRLDEIDVRSVEKLKAGLLADKDKDGLPKRACSRKYVNNALIVLGRTLRYAHELEVIDKVPRIKLLKVPPQKFDFLERHELEALLVMAAQKSSDFYAAIVIGAEAGLRIGEIRALTWGDVDFAREILTVRRSDYRGHVDSPKSGRDRKIPLTRRLAAALKAARHLKGDLVFSTSRGTRWKDNNAQRVLDGVCRRAQLRRITWHVLRHTFCSHLAMAGAPPRAIQELAGHASIQTTMRYMHLSPSASRDAIRLLDSPPGQATGGQRTTDVP